MPFLILIYEVVFVIDIDGLIKRLKLDAYQKTFDEIGRSESTVVKLSKDSEVLYLKIGKGSIQNLNKVLLFLEDKDVIAPKVINSGRYKDYYYVLMTECRGKMTYELDPLFAAEVLGRTLKKIHQLPHPTGVLVKDKNHYHKELMKIEKDKLSEDDQLFISHFDSISLQDDLVFSHGDYCLPNILYDGKNASLIDLDYAGVTFRYSDILDCIWSLEYNFHTSIYTDTFLQAYGIEKLDSVKVRDMKTIHRLMEIKGY